MPTQTTRPGKKTRIRFGAHRQHLPPVSFAADVNPATTTSSAPREPVRIVGFVVNGVDLSKEPDENPDIANDSNPEPVDRERLAKISRDRVIVNLWDDHIGNHCEPPLVNESSFPEADLDHLSEEITLVVEKILLNRSTSARTARFISLVIAELSLRRRVDEAKFKFMHGCKACFDTIRLRVEPSRYEHYLRSTLKLHLLPTDDQLMSVLRETIVILQDISTNNGPLEYGPYPVSTVNDPKSNDDAGEWSTYWKTSTSRLELSYARAKADVGGSILFLAAFLIALRECKELQEQAHVGCCIDVLAEVLPVRPKYEKYREYLQRGFLSSAMEELIGYKGPNSTWGKLLL